VTHTQVTGEDRHDKRDEQREMWHTQVTIVPMRSTNEWEEKREEEITQQNNNDKRRKKRRWRNNKTRREEKKRNVSCQTLETNTMSNVSHRYKKEKTNREKRRNQEKRRDQWVRLITCWDRLGLRARTALNTDVCVRRKEEIKCVCFYIRCVSGRITTSQWFAGSMRKKWLTCMLMRENRGSIFGVDADVCSDRWRKKYTVNPMWFGVRYSEQALHLVARAT
jgi:hypothetical protein